MDIGWWRKNYLGELVREMGSSVKPYYQEYEFSQAIDVSVIGKFCFSFLRRRRGLYEKKKS